MSLDDEPVLISHAVNLVLFALVSLGWVTIPSTTIDAVATAVGAVVAVCAALWARRKVTAGTDQPGRHEK